MCHGGRCNSCGEWIKSVLVRRLELSGLVNAPKRIFVRCWCNVGVLALLQGKLS